MSDRRVLYIVEGAKGEPRFLKKMHQVLFGTRPENIFVVGTTIHGLLRSVFPEGEAEEGLDIVSVLREISGEEHRDVLEKEFSDVYLVFDMDPQDPRYDPKRLGAAMEYFDNPTENGKLYLNYPMLESYKHLTCLDDEGYLHRTIDRHSISCYKEIVGKECCMELQNLSGYTENEFTTIIRFNLKKTDMILGGEGNIPTTETFLSWNGHELLEIQTEMMEREGLIFVLNTSVFNAVDFSPSRFCEYHPDKEHSCE